MDRVEERMVKKIVGRKGKATRRSWAMAGRQSGKGKEEKGKPGFEGANEGNEDSK